jgi:outer membrane protein OmpA-like peptidoglycan-associated protein
MFSQDDDGQQGLVLAFVFGLLAFVIALVIGISVHQRHPPTSSVNAVPAAPVALAPQTVSPVPPPETAASAAQADLAAQTVSDAASVKVEQGVVKFYFASGKADLAPGASEALVDVVKGAQSGRKLVISGFHDATGDAAKNAALARQRALAVRNALKALGVAEQQMELKKPEPLAGNGSDAEARRVEISLQ